MKQCRIARERALGVLLGEDAGGIGVRLARVDLERQPRLARRGDVAAEAFRLRLGCRVLVVVVEPRLADGDHLGVLGEPHDLLDADIELLVRLVGMRADRAINVGVALGDGEDLGQAPDARRDRHDHADPRRLGAPDHGLAVLRELREIEVAVVIDEHQPRPCLRTAASPADPVAASGST